MYLHFVIDSVYIEKFISFVTKHFPDQKHVFVAVKRSNVKYVSSNRLHVFNSPISSELRRLVSKSDKIFVHSLFNTWVIVWLLMNRKLLKKTYCFLWGGDVYSYWLQDKHSINSIMVERLKSTFMRKIRKVIMEFREDYEFVQSKYNINTDYYEAFYPAPVDFETLDNVPNKSAHNNTIRIMVGNSASDSNRHFEILEALWKNQIVRSAHDIEIMCPLSYGDMEYARKVIEYGKSKFGERFKPLTELLPPEEYAKVLASVDVAVFDHKRQQAFSNILALLYLGKKVYVRSDVTTWQFLRRIGVTVADTNDILANEKEDLFLFNRDLADANREKIYTQFSEERCVQLWSNLFAE